MVGKNEQLAKAIFGLQIFLWSKVTEKTIFRKLQDFVGPAMLCSSCKHQLDTNFVAIYTSQYLKIPSFYLELLRLITLWRHYYT